MCPDMSTLLSFPPAVYSFRNIDLVYDFLLSIGMKPYVELRYSTCVEIVRFFTHRLCKLHASCALIWQQHRLPLPRWPFPQPKTVSLTLSLANNNPPKNYSDWSNLIIAFANHIIDRYSLAEVSTWNFEVWNEVRTF